MVKESFTLISKEKKTSRSHKRHEYEGMSTEAYGYMNEMKVLQALKTMKHVN